jgi:GT2 family glycosyltransferase
VSAADAADRTRARFLLVTVTDASAPSRAHLHTLLESLGRQRAAIELVLVMRDSGSRPREADNVRIHALSQPLRISLSRARNVAIDYAREQRLLEAADVVGFPDDDCSYPSGLLARVAALIDDGNDIVVGTYGPAADRVDRERFPSTGRPLSAALTMRTVSSNNMFFAAHVVAAVGNFDERFGLGARYGAAEDTDYVLRALRLGAQGSYAPRDIFVSHPYKADRQGQYYVGNVAVEAKHALGGGTGVRLARRLASGPVLMLRGQITARDYVRATCGAVRLLAGGR